jgi:DNA-binding XRE family transcriptional regulator
MLKSPPAGRYVHQLRGRTACFSIRRKAMERQSTPFSTEFGRRVARRRRILGLTQRQVAAHVGVHRSHITQIEGGVYKSMRLEQLALLADVLQTSTDYLLQRTADDPGVIPPIRSPGEASCPRSSTLPPVDHVPEETDHADCTTTLAPRNASWPTCSTFSTAASIGARHTVYKALKPASVDA